MIIEEKKSVRGETASPRANITEPLSAVSSTPSSSTETPSTNINDEKNDQQKQHQQHLRSHNRTDIIRQEASFLGWTISRWLLLLANTMLLIYGCVFFAAACATYGKGYERAVVIVVANRSILAVGFTASLFCIIASVLGYIGVLHKNRRYLSYYSLLLWVCFALITTVGYLSFKERTWNLKAQLGVRWRHDYNLQQRELLQANLHCCGFENPSDHAAYFSRCWAESLLPGCQHKFYLFENAFLLNAYTTAFSILPLHIAVMMVSILCSNHVDIVFGTRQQPPIPYLGQYHDWREWEQAQKQK